MCDLAMKTGWLALVAMGVFLPAVGSQAQIPAFPGADGAAVHVTGGRGGIVYHVTRLDRNNSDAAKGTLRYGLTDSNFNHQPRTIVFDVAGTFWLGRFGAEKGHMNGWDTQSRLNLGNNVTIAGETAPGPVYIMGGVVKAGSSNVILRNITVAPGYGMRGFEKPDEVPPELPRAGDFPDAYVYDAIDIGGQGILISHVTTLYATDESISANEQARDVTIQYCNISQGQNYPQADAEGSGYTGHALGSLLQAGTDAKISVLHCLYAHQKGRLPRVGSESGAGAVNDFRNNVFYNWLGTAGTGASGQPSSNNFIHNFYLAGPGGDDVSGVRIVSAKGGTGLFDGKGAAWTRAYVTGNLKDTNKDGDPNDAVAADASFVNVASQGSAYDVNIGVTLGAQAALTDVLRHVGTRWWERDYDPLTGNGEAIDTPDERLIHEAMTGTGKIMAWADDPFNSDPNEGVEWRKLLSLRADPTSGAAPFTRPAGWDTDQDGMPNAWEREHSLDVDVADNNADFDGDEYTNLEEYLNELAAWPAPGDVLFCSDGPRYAEVSNWEVQGVSLGAGRKPVATSSKWQPSRYDTAVIDNRRVVVDAVGQHAGVLRVINGGTLDITQGWLKIAKTLQIGDENAASVRLSGGLLRVGIMSEGRCGSFVFTGGTLAADVVDFDLLVQAGTVSPGDGPGTTQVNGDLTMASGSSLGFELGTTAPGGSDRVIVNGNLTLGCTLNVSALPGFGAGTYTVIVYSGTLNGAPSLGSCPVGYVVTVDTGTPGEVKLVVEPQK